MFTMVEYEAPAPGAKYFVKFIRVGERVFTTESQGVTVEHKDLAKEEGILDDIEHHRDEDASMVDAGFLNVSDDILVVAGRSGTLDLPDRYRRKGEARAKTLDVLSTLTEGYKVLDANQHF